MVNLFTDLVASLVVLHLISVLQIVRMNPGARAIDPCLWLVEDCFAPLSFVVFFFLAGLKMAMSVLSSLGASLEESRALPTTFTGRCSFSLVCACSDHSRRLGCTGAILLYLIDVFEVALVRTEIRSMYLTSVTCIVMQ